MKNIIELTKREMWFRWLHWGAQAVLKGRHHRYELDRLVLTTNTITGCDGGRVHRVRSEKDLPFKPGMYKVITNSKRKLLLVWTGEVGSYPPVDEHLDKIKEMDWYFKTGNLRDAIYGLVRREVNINPKHLKDAIGDFDEHVTILSKNQIENYIPYPVFVNYSMGSIHRTALIMSSTSPTINYTSLTPSTSSTVGSC